MGEIGFGDPTLPDDWDFDGDKGGGGSFVLALGDLRRFCFVSSSSGEARGEVSTSLVALGLSLGEGEIETLEKDVWSEF